MYDYNWKLPGSATSDEIEEGDEGDDFYNQNAWCKICRLLLGNRSGAVYKLNCGHYFHNNCLVTTCNSNVKKCPTCSTEIANAECASVIGFKNKTLDDPTFFEDADANEYLLELYNSSDNNNNNNNMYNYHDDTENNLLPQQGGKKKNKKSKKSRQNKKSVNKRGRKNKKSRKHKRGLTK